MTANETVVLMLALQADPHPLRYSVAYRAVRGERAQALMNTLRKKGALEHPRYDNWYLTEKGRIAAALARAKDPKLVAAFPVEMATSQLEDSHKQR